MGIFGETVTLVNRTLLPLSVMWDGRLYRFPPGRTPNCPLSVANAALVQCVLMGSEHPYDPSQFTSLFGIEGDPNYPCGALEQSKIIERIDRSKLPKNLQSPEQIDAGGATYFEAQLPGCDMRNEIAVSKS